MGGDSRSEGRGFESPILYTGWTFFTLICLFENTENKRKRGRGWPFKKTSGLRYKAIAWVN